MVIVGAKYYLIAPALLSIGLRKGSEAPETLANAVQSEPITWSTLRTRDMPETAISGSLMGGIHASINCMQSLVYFLLCFDCELSIDGVRRGAFTGSLGGAILCSAIQLSLNEVEVQRVKYLLRRQKRLQDSQMQSPALPKTQEPFMTRLLGWLGGTEVNREQYLEKLKKERDMVLAEIQRLEKEQHDKTSPR
jgi:hypothetical protein